ncbi:unnamed protein product, partial [Amoebophrya sp. A25]
SQYTRKKCRTNQNLAMTSVANVGWAKYPHWSSYKGVLKIPGETGGKNKCRDVCELYAYDGCNCYTVEFT